MDTWNAVELATRIGVSLPTLHSLLDREHVVRTGRGVERSVPVAVAERILRSRPHGYSPTDLRILAALLASPLGLGSSRGIAAVAGVSPTSVGRALPRLAALGLVRRDGRRAIRAGRVTTEPRFTLDLRSPAWADVATAVAGVRLPTREIEPAARMPQSFWHLFWNAAPAALRVDQDGAFIARRMLDSGGATAVQWALEHIATADLLAAVRGRGADARTRAMVENWVAA